jgi:hypothetical protein
MGFEHLELALAVVVQVMIDSETAGVMFTPLSAELPFVAGDNLKLMPDVKEKIARRKRRFQKFVRPMKREYIGRCQPAQYLRTENQKNKMTQ